MLTQGDALGYVLLGFQPVFDLIISFTGQQYKRVEEVGLDIYEHG